MKELLTHQQRAIQHLHEWRVGALFMEPGTGKTRVAVELIRQLADVTMVIWLGPLRTLPSVREEIEQWGGVPSLLMVGVESISGSDRVYMETRSQVNGCCFCVVDESLKIKNIDAKRTKHIIELGQLCSYRIILNGTPLSRDLLDLYPQMQFLSPRILNMTQAQFKDTFCKYTTVTKRLSAFRQIRKEYITGYENIDYLYSLIRQYIYECSLSLGIRQLYDTCTYDVTGDALEEYTAIKEKYLDDEMMELKNNNIFLEMTSKMQHAYCDSDEKIECAKGIITDEPHTIIFCRFVRSQERCRKEFPKALVLSYQKEAFGLNLQDYHTTIYFDKVWDYALRLQSSRRTFRTGQQQDCRYYDLTGNVGLERLIDKNIQKKTTMSEYFKKASLQDLKRDL